MLKEECHTQQIFFSVNYSQGSVLRLIYALFDCVELFVTLVHVYILFSMRVNYYMVCLMV